MPDSPLCPNCSRPIRFARRLHSDGSLKEKNEDTNVYQCMRCTVALVTEDHVPV